MAAGKFAHRLFESAEIWIEPEHHLAGFGFHGHIIQSAKLGFQFSTKVKIGGGIYIMESRRGDIASAISSVDEGRGVIILTDLFGGTPSNLAISLMETGRIEVIAGVNLPMLIRLERARRTMNVVDAVAAAREAGRKYISVASEVLGEAAA